jgi:ATP-dependent Clp protease ATP-binding subunit ClpA
MTNMAARCWTQGIRSTQFFARYELSTLGGGTIEPAHILLGLLHESGGQVGAILAKWNIPLGELRQQLEAQAGHGDRVATSVEVPFSTSAKRVLTFAAEEADPAESSDGATAYAARRTPRG